MDNKEYTIDLKELIMVFLEKFWIILIVMVVGGAAAFGYSRYVLPLEYSSHISMYVQSYTNTSTNTDNPQNNISNSKQLINTYIEVLKDDAVMRAVGVELQKIFPESTLESCFRINEGVITPSSLRACIAITSVTDTSALTVKTTTKDPEIAASICNTLAVVAPDFIRDAVGVGSISTIDTAYANKTPVAPNTMKNTALGALVGMVLAMAVIFLFFFFDNTVKDSETLEERYHKAIIGEVPTIVESRKQKQEQKKTGEDHQFRMTDPETPFHVVESYKSIRTNVSFALSTGEKKIVAISSPNPGEGKSTTAANIAIAAAQSKKRVLLIDADMRKPRQHRFFHLQNKCGLSTIASKTGTADECIQKDVMPHLDVLTAGPIPPNPSELLSSRTAGNMLAELSGQYSLIVIDLPPLCVVSDALTLSDRVAGLIMVVRYGKTAFEDIEEAQRRMELSNMKLLGFVLNDVELKHTKSGYRYKYKSYKSKSGYGYGYGYGDRIKQATDADEKQAESPETKKSKAADDKSAKKSSK